MNIDYIRKELIHCKKHEQKLTIPEIMGIPRNEGAVIRWMANILNPFSNGLNTTPLNYFITDITKDSLSNDELMSADIIPEFMLDSRYKNILLISTKKYLICTEVKIDSSESGVMQTSFSSENLSSCRLSDYKEKLDTMRGEKTLYCIYLTTDSEKNVPSQSDIRVIRFSELMDILPVISEDMILDKTYVLYAFRQYVNAVLTKKSTYPVYNDKVRFHYDHLSEKSDIYKVFNGTALMGVIEECEREYEKYFEKAVTWLTRKIASKGYLNYRFYPGKGGTCWWAFMRSKEWLDLFFHYELVWKSSEKLITKDAYLEIHLETTDENIISFFTADNPDIEYIKNKNTYVLLSKNIKIDLTSQTKAEKTIETILNLIQSSDFEKLAKKADSYLK